MFSYTFKSYSTWFNNSDISTFLLFMTSNIIIIIDQYITISYNVLFFTTLRYLEIFYYILLICDYILYSNLIRFKLQYITN